MHLDVVLVYTRVMWLMVKLLNQWSVGDCGQGLTASTVKEFQQPWSKKDIKAFLALCGYYQKFIKQFSTIVTPLTELTRKSMPNKVKWGSRSEKAFSMLKCLLTQAFILSTPDWSKPFILQTDWDIFSLKLMK